MAIWLLAALAMVLEVPKQDSQGRPIITSPAPALRFELRTAPRPGGVDYPFAEQTARGAAVLSRFPTFSLSDRRIHVSGPWYSDPSANLLFRHGVTSLEAMPNFRLEPGPCDIRDLRRDRKWQLMCDPLFWGYALQLADRLEAANPADPRIAALREFGRNHRFTPDEQAFRALGAFAWQGESDQADSDGGGVAFPCIDIELTGGWEHQRSCFGWIYEGMAKAAAEKGLTITPITYGQWTFSVGAVAQSMRSGGRGYPEYLLPQNDYLSTPDPTLSVVERLGGVISMDGYMQGIWGNEPFYQRNRDGSLVLKDGKPLFSTCAATTAYGQAIPLETNEAARCLQDLYRQAARLYLMHHWMAGEYPSMSVMRRPYLRRSTIGAWTRITNEGVQGVEHNDRPLPGWLMETLTGLYLFLADDIVVWSSDTNTKPGPLGADHSATWQYNAHGVVEYIIKAAHRYSSLDPVHHGPFRWCWFNLPMVNQNETDGDRYDQKPLVFGKLRSYKGKPWVEMWAAFPALDDQPCTLQVWATKGARKSPVYTIKLANGRTSFLDAWQLPAGFDGLEGEDITLRYRDQLGKVHQIRGDWRRNEPQPGLQ